MKIPVVERDSRISGWLTRAVPGSRQTGCGRWDLGSKNGAGIAGSACIEEDWLVLRLPLEDTGANWNKWSLLKRNGDLAGLCKFVQDSSRRFPELRADLPLDCGDNFETLPQRILETLRDFRAASETWTGAMGTSEGGIAQGAGTAIHTPEDSTALARTLKETGWPFVERSPQMHVVDLEARDFFAQATIESQNGRDIVAGTEAAQYESLSDGQRKALGIFLLAACGVLRMARASVLETEASTRVRFEVRLTDLNPAELGHALAALSVATDLCAREARCFEDRQTAEIYLLIEDGTGVENE